MFCVDTDGYGDKALWQADSMEDPRPMPVAYQYDTHPAVWDAAVATLTGKGE